MNWSTAISRLSEAGMTQSKIAEACGVSQSTISDLARGATKSPTYELGKALEKMLDALPQGAPPAAAPALAPAAQQQGA